jgi:hypothetical protein
MRTQRISGDLKVRRAAATKGMNEINGRRPSAWVASEAIHELMLAPTWSHIFPPTHRRTRAASGFVTGRRT